MRMLVVDDDRELARFYRALLEDQGHEVVTAASGAEALQRLAADPDVVLLDLMMPGIDGYEVLSRIRRSPRHEDVPVVVLSAAVSPLRGAIAGADGFVRKPFAFDHLLNAIDSATHARSLHHPR
ncbi:MAG: response regulator [Candidatus Limnocylindria bacterium]